MADLRLILLAAFSSLIFCGQAVSGSASYQFGSTVEAGEIFRLRLTDLPDETDLSVDIETNQPARFLLLSEADTIDFPDLEAPLFDVSVSRSVDIDVRISDGGNYFIVVDNLSGENTVAFGFIIHAETVSD